MSAQRWTTRPPKDFVHASKNDFLRMITIMLPKPIPLNNLFLNVPHRGRVITPKYREWRDKAARGITAQIMAAIPEHRLLNMRGPVELNITVIEGRYDLDNTAKCLLDALVANGIIDGDGFAVVRKITLAFGAVAGARVEITAAAPWVQRRGAGKRK